MTDENIESNRRDFLTGQSALNAAREKAAQALEEHKHGSIGGPESVDRQTGYVEQYCKNAMACEFELLFNLHQYPQSGAAAMEAFQLIDDLEDQLTVYRDHSELSRLNQRAFDEPVPVEKRLFEVLQQATSIHASTGGAFDVTSSPLTRLWGFDKRSGSLPEPGEIESTLEHVGVQHIQLDAIAQSVRFLKQGVSINLGGIGKGHALDRVGELFETHSIRDFVIHGGQSSVLAGGSSKTLPGNDATGWSVGVTHPTIPGIRLGEVTLNNQALGTSGTARQGFYHQGKRYGHIIDPRTGWPTSHFLSTTVIAPSAAEADALATAFYVMRLEEIESFLINRNDVGAILVAEDQSQKDKIRTTVINLDGQWMEGGN